MTDAETGDQPGAEAGTRAGTGARAGGSAPLPADRYGRRTGRPVARWRPALLLAAAVAAGLVVALVAYRNLGDPGVSGTVTAFTTTADHVDITFIVQRNKSDKSAVCLVRARSEPGDEVGSAEVRVPPGADQTTMTYRLHTSARPVTGELTGCRYAATR